MQIAARTACLFIFGALLAYHGLAQPADLSAVLSSPVPDALHFENGKLVRNATQWRARRSEILDLFAAQVYGRTPKETAKLRFQQEALDDRTTVLGVPAHRKEVAINLSQGTESRLIHVLLYLPANINAPVPVIVGLNFGGNQTVAADPGIALNDIWVRDSSGNSSSVNSERSKFIRQRATSDSRGKAASQWQVDKIISHGYALATAYYGDIEPDFSGAMEQGVRALFLQPGQTQWPPNSWGALGAWAWGLSRIADYLQSDPAIDGKRIAIFGFSRLGKAALWAAAQDQRFNLVLSNESGVGGASLYRAKSAETIEHLNTAFPHWFCANFHEYTGHPDRVPVDGNLLLSLIAPRPLYVGSAEQDTFSCPPAEFLSTVLASKVYRLLGKRALGPNEHMPPVNHPVIEGNVAYHVRTGKHNVTEFDWEQYLHFMDLHFKQH